MSRVPTTDEIAEALAYAAREAERFLAELPDAPVREKHSDEAALAFGGPLPEDGDGALVAITELVTAGLAGTVRSAGPRFFHWVIGGTTPASIAADWLASAIDQNVGDWDASPLGTQLETVSLAWLRELFGLPKEWGGVLTTGATMANFVGLACARRWWAERHGVDVDEAGLSGLPPAPVFGGGYVHPSDVKALGMLGIGRAQVRRFSRDAVGRLDLEAMEDALRELGGAPAILICSAGEVNAGDFDPVGPMADLAESYGAWLHVDGAFGLFAALSARTEHLVDGVSRADSVIADGHKWLNVPHESGFAFVRDGAALARVFGGASAAYLPKLGGRHANWGWLGPEMSRRARSIAVWATLRAYGLAGYRAIVERGLDNARHLAALVDEAPDFERLADVTLNVVCFRYRPEGVSDDRLDDLNHRIGEAIIRDGRVYVGTTDYGGRVAFRPTFVNWRTTREDAALVLEVIRDLAEPILAGG